MYFARVLVDSFILLKRAPRLFIPKILIAFLFLPIIVLTMTLVVQYNFLTPQSIVGRSQAELSGLLFQLFFLLAYIPIVYFVDYILVNPMYPVMIEQFYRKKDIDFRKAFVQVIKHFGAILSSVLLFSVLFFGTLIPLGLLAVNFLMARSDLLFFISAAMACIALFVILLLFYLLYPVSSIEKLDFRQTIGKTVKTSFKCKGDVLKALIISLVTSGLSYFFSGEMIVVSLLGKIELTLLFFFLLLVTRMLVAVFTTYQYVLNSVFYMGFEKGVFLEK